MSKLNRSYQVVIVGGGPVGLFLAILLRRNDIDCVVLEKRTEPTTHSRSLGIHPVSLELFDTVGLADRFVEEGIKIEKGIAWGDKQKIGELSFDSCPGPFRFVLALPQYRTEDLLEQHLNEIAPECLVRGAELQYLNQENGNTVNLSVSIDGDSPQISCNLLVGCDGKNSTVRQRAGFDFEGKRYRDTYIMGDFSDHTDFGSAAGIFLSSDGLIESFPLTDEKRRWVVKTQEFIQDADRELLEQMVLKRTGFDLTEEKNFMLSSFGTQRYIADPTAEKRVLLAGDAAHIVSPIGGQGMNLGWLDAREILSIIKTILEKPSELDRQINIYNTNRIKAAKKAIRRAELNMRLGRRSAFPAFKNSLVWCMLNTPLKHLMARIFTMRGLDRWPF